MQYYEEHRIHSYFFKFELLKSQAEDVQGIMDKDEEFFEPVFSPLTVDSAAMGGLDVKEC